MYQNEGGSKFFEGFLGY